MEAASNEAVATVAPHPIEVNESGMPSPSKSSFAQLFSGNGSIVSAVPSPSSSVSALSPVPSPSVSTSSAESSGNASETSHVPSLSSSMSRVRVLVHPWAIVSGFPSSSVSVSAHSSSEKASFTSSVPSASSSVSALLPIPSTSVSTHS